MILIGVLSTVDMAKTPESLQTDPRVIEAQQRLFGDEQFQGANPQMQLQMALLTTQNVVERLLAHPNGALEIDATVATQELSRLTSVFISERPQYDTVHCGSHVLLQGRKSPITP